MSENTTLSIAVLSGKGGVGKSNLSLNMAFALNMRGFKVLIIDCDLGLANLDVLLGLSPQAHVKTLLESDATPEEVIISVNGQGLDLLPANSGILENYDHEHQLPEMLAQKLAETVSRYDFVFLDIGAGIAPLALTFGAMAHMRTLVITPEPTSLTDSYALVKVMATRHGVKDHFVIVNQAASDKEDEQAFKRICAACEHFLSITPTHLGKVAADKNLIEAVRRQKPLITEFPDSPAAVDIMTIADKLQKVREKMMPVINKMPPLRKISTYQN